MHSWLHCAADVLAGETDAPAGEFLLSNRTIDLVLDAAGRAAHESGSRLNAPLLCYLLGRASERSGRPVEDLVEALQAASRPEAGARV